MSWWDTSGFTNLASQALKNAQKKIDKVLDIEEDERERRRRGSNKKKVQAREGEAGVADQPGEDFWSTWMSSAGGGSSTARKNSEGSEQVSSSWSFPWTGTKEGDHGVAAASDITSLVAASSEPAVRDSTQTPDTTKRTATSTEAGIFSDNMTVGKEVENSLDVHISDQSTEETKHVSDDSVNKDNDNVLDIQCSDQSAEEIKDFSDKIVDSKEENVSFKVEVQHKEEQVSDGWQDFSMNESAFDLNESAESKAKSHTNEPQGYNKLDSGFKEESRAEADIEQSVIANNTNEVNLNVFREDGPTDSVKEDSFDENIQDNLDTDKYVERLPKDEDSNEKFASQVLPDLGDEVSRLCVGDSGHKPDLDMTVDDCIDQDRENTADSSKNLDFIMKGEESEDCAKDLDSVTKGEGIVMYDSSLTQVVDESIESKDETIQNTNESIQNTDGTIQNKDEINSLKDISETTKLVDQDAYKQEINSESMKESSSSSFAELSEECVSEGTNNTTSTLPQSSELHDVGEQTAKQSEHGLEPNESVVQTESETEVPPVVHNEPHVSDSRDVESDPTMAKSEQLNLSQEYVNISSVSSESGASPSLNSSSSNTLAEDPLHTSSDLDLGNSRTSSDLDLPVGRPGSTGSSDTSRFDSSLDTVVDKSAWESQDVPATEPPPYSLFDGSEAKEGSGSDQDVGSVDSSEVKIMLEEAMKESKTEDSNSDNHSSGGKSESSKVDSEHDKSGCSGHESSDDIETTTSSDIEIIQAPGNNGEGKFHTTFDLSPLKIALQKTAGGQGHHRSDSQSSSSAHSKAGEMEHLSPERGEGTHWREEEMGHHDLQSVQEESQDSPYHPERLLKKLAEMAEVLQARETKLVELSKENHQLMEDKNILNNQLRQLEEIREAETADVTALTDEFTARLGESEKKIQAIMKDKESLKQQLTVAQKEIQKGSGKPDLEALLEEKSEQVEELLAEGEKLSKQQLQSSTIIKKLRAKEKETEATITSQKKKLEEQSQELERLKVVLDSKEEMEKKQSEAITQLNGAVQSQDKELGKIRNDLEEAQERNRGLQSALDSSYKEMAELHRSNASQDSKAQEAALSAETQVREELKAAMEREQQKFRMERETFIIQVDDLRLDMTRLEKEHSRREDILRQEIAHLQQRHQEDESRSQELTHTVTSATRPLLRQIENLQATFGAQSTAWEKVEKNLTDRLAEAQTGLAIAQEKERSATDKLMEVTARVTTLEASSTRLKQDKAQLAAQLDGERAKVEELQDVKLGVIAQLESSKQKMSEELNQLKVEKVHLESQLNVEKSKTDNERKKTAGLEEQLRLFERERPKSRGTPSPSPSMSVSRQESLSGSFYEGHSPGWNWSYHEDQDSVTGGLPKGGTMYDSLRHSGAAIVVENLQSQLKLREGEIVQLQSEIGQLERTRESMARELVDLTYKNEELEENKVAHERLKKEYEELNSRYSALLQMYGEKEEQVQELRLDLQDVKEMYKSQIDALLAQ